MFQGRGLGQLRCIPRLCGTISPPATLKAYGVCQSGLECGVTVYLIGLCLQVVLFSGYKVCRVQ